MQRKWHEFPLSDLREDLLNGHDFALRDLSDDILAVKQKIRLIADMKGLPSNFKRKVLQRFVQIVDIESPVFPSLLVPVFCLIADPFELLYFLLVEGVALKIVIVGREELRDGMDAVVFEDVAEVSEVVDHADLLDLVDGLCEVEANQVRSNSVMLSIFDLYSILRDIHPRSCFTPEIDDVETFEAVVLELRMFWCQPHSFYLQRQSIQLHIS